MAIKLKLSALAPRQEGEYFLLRLAFEDISKKMKRLSRKATKRGGTPATLEIVAEELVSLIEPNPLTGGYVDPPRMISVLRVKAAGQLFKMNGYELVCSLEHTPAGNLIRKAPGHEDDDVVAYREAPSNCDHCNTRRTRHDTYVLKDESGKLMQVGRNCLADFLRSEDVASILNSREVQELLHGADIGESSFDDNAFSGGGGGEYFYNLNKVAALSFREVRRNGYRKASNESGTTKGAVSFALNNRPQYDRGLAFEWDDAQATEEDYEGAKEIIQFVENMEGESDYVHNLKVVFARGGVDYRSLGIAVSAASSYFRHLGQVAERKAKLNEHFGEVKTRYDLELTLVRRSGYDTAFGWKSILIFEDEKGRNFVWKTMSPPNIDVGAKLIGKGTIKEHTEYKERKQTQLTRCKFEVAEEEKAA